MDATILVSAAAVSLGMLLGELPGPAHDRTGVALRGIPISWRTRARVGVPVTLLALAVAAGRLWPRAAG
jgi:hypothetical protein